MWQVWLVEICKLWDRSLGRIFLKACFKERRFRREKKRSCFLESRWLIVRPEKILIIFYRIKNQINGWNLKVGRFWIKIQLLSLKPKLSTTMLIVSCDSPPPKEPLPKLVWASCIESDSKSQEAFSHRAQQSLTICLKQNTCACFRYIDRSNFVLTHLLPLINNNLLLVRFVSLW